MTRFTLILLSIMTITNMACSNKIDRSIRPISKKLPSVNIKTPQSFELKNGMKVFVVSEHKLPKIDVQLSIDRPDVLQGNKKGVMLLLSTMFGKGTDKISKDEFNDEVDFMGSNISIYSRGATINTLTRNFENTMKLMADAFLNPNFTQNELNSEKNKEISGLKFSENNIDAIASNMKYKLLFGKNHPSGEVETKETVSNVELNDIKEYYKKYITPNNAYMVVVGDIDFEKAKKIITKNFDKWGVSKNNKNTILKKVENTKTDLTIVDLPEAVQSYIVINKLFDIKIKDKNYLALRLANHILGGGATSKLFMNLREDKGYTYGSYSSVSNNKYTKSIFEASAKVRNDVVRESVEEILKEISSIANSVTEKELKSSKAVFIGNFIMNSKNIGRFALNTEIEGLDKDYYKNYINNINAVTLDDIKRVSKQYFKTDDMNILVVGKSSEITKPLEKLNYKINILDKKGNKLKTK